MGFSGFNVNQASAFFSRLNSNCESIMMLIGKGGYDFVVAVSTGWACQEAVEYFKNTFKPEFDNLISSIYSNFERIKDDALYAIKKWAITTGDESINVIVSSIVKPQPIDIGRIKDNLEGVRGADKDQIALATLKFENLIENLTTMLKETKGIAANSGFLGGDQESELINRLTRLQEMVESSTKNIVSKATQMVDDTVVKYGSLANQLKTKFTSSN